MWVLLWNQLSKSGGLDIGHVVSLDLAGLVWFRMTSMLEPEAFVEYGFGWGLVFLRCIQC